MQTRRLLAFLSATIHCWLMVILLTRTHRAFSVKMLLNSLDPIVYKCMGLFLPRCKTLHFSVLNFMRFLLVHLPGLLRSL